LLAKQIPSSPVSSGVDVAKLDDVHGIGIAVTTMADEKSGVDKKCQRAGAPARDLLG
jgi:hypothetical protein